MGDERPTFSIVIATHNRPQKVCALLESLQRLPSLSLKTVVVVDDSDAKVDLSDRFSNLSVRHICLEGGRVFLSKARNIGWRVCESDFVYFIDDDNVITETTLDGPFQVLLDHPEVAAVMPAVLYKENPNLVWVYATPLQPGKWGHILVGRNEPRVADLEGRLLPTDALPNAFVCRRDALDQIGGFDETLVMSSSADLAMRLESAGWKVYAHGGVHPPRCGTSGPDGVLVESPWGRPGPGFPGRSRLVHLDATTPSSIQVVRGSCNPTRAWIHGTKPLSLRNPKRSPRREGRRDATSGLS